ncbi:MAG: hypothetical protein K1X92_01010 [Bacteroidia bacterium]|nr:hypothetical protein [Bacteroidia bacterium]
MIRDVFWGKDAGNNKVLVTVVSDSVKPEIQVVNVFRPDDLEESVFMKLKNDLFDIWRDGGEIDFPKGSSLKWNIKTNPHYPEDLPKPEKEDKAESLVRKIRRNILQVYSAGFRDEVQQLLNGFEKKITGLNEWNKEDRLFLQNYETVIRGAGELYNQIERTGKWEDNEWLTPSDSYSLRQIIKTLYQTLDALHLKSVTNNYQKMQINLEKFLQKVQSAIPAREIKEAAHELKNEIRETELTRQQKDELFQTINDAVDGINRKQEEERAVLEKVSEMNFEDYESRLKELAVEVEQATFFQEVRESLKQIQREIRDAKLLPPQRKSLMDSLDELFSALSDRQSDEKKNLSSISEAQFPVLSERLDIGKRLAAYNDDFQETREYLKTLQNDVFEARLTREHREALKTGLNEAFEKVNGRADKLFAERKRLHEKKGMEMENLRLKKRQEWEFRMKEKIIYTEKNIKNLQNAIENDEFYLQQQEEKWADSKEERIEKNIARIKSQIIERQNKIEEYRKEVAAIEEKLKED